MEALRLLDAHRAHLRQSGLTDEAIASAQIFSVTDPRQAAALLNWSKSPPFTSSIGIPIFDVKGDRVLTVLRPDKPRMKDEKPVKYEWPNERPSRLYFPPLVPPTSWRDAAVPLLITEGVKKSLAAAQYGAACLAASGVWMFHDSAHKKATKEWRLHDDLA